MTLRALSVALTALLHVALASAAPRQSLGLAWAQVSFTPPGSTGVTQTQTTETPPATTPTVPVVTPDQAAPPQQPLVLAPGIVVAPGAATLPTGGATSPVQASPPPFGSVPERPTTPNGGASPATMSPAAPSAGASSASAPSTNCVAAAEQTNISLPAGGGKVVFSPKLSPPGCRLTIQSSAPWLVASPDGGTAFSVGMNNSRSVREATLRAGAALLRVRQEAGKFVSFAVAPGRLDLTVEKKSPKPQTLNVWSDSPGVTFSASPAAAKWISVVPDSRNRSGKAKFRITIDAAALAPGKHEGAVEVHSPGAFNSPIRIPVAVTVSPKR